MTIVEKKRIYELREQGLGYKAIAKELSLTPSAVRCVCAAKEKDDMLAGSCKNCGIRIISVKGRKKRFRFLFPIQRKKEANGREGKGIFDRKMPCLP